MNALATLTHGYISLDKEPNPPPPPPMILSAVQEAPPAPPAGFATSVNRLVVTPGSGG